jgi:hypothetical protein
MLKGREPAKGWVEAAGELVSKLDELEEKLHNPRARITYDILAMRGGAKLYSLVVPIYCIVRDADGVPTQGMRELFAERSKELEGVLAEWKTQLGAVAGLNAQAKTLGLDYVAVPAS